LINTDKINKDVLYVWHAEISGTGSRSNILWIIIGSDRRPETKQGIEGKIVRFRSGRVRAKDC